MQGVLEREPAMHTTHETIFSPNNNYHQFALIATPSRSGAPVESMACGVCSFL